MSRMNGFGRLPDTSMQVGRLPDTSMQVGRLPTVENVAGGLGRMGDLGAALTMGDMTSLKTAAAAPKTPAGAAARKQRLFPQGMKASSGIPRAKPAGAARPLPLANKMSPKAVAMTNAAAAKINVVAKKAAATKAPGLIEKGLKLAAAQKSALPPGTNVAKGITTAANAAAKAAAAADVLKKKAVAALKSNDKRAAGIAAVQAVQATRKAAELGTSAAKTALVIQKEQQAHELEKKASTLASKAETNAALTGESSSTLADRAKAQELGAQAKKLRTEAALVATMRPPIWMIPSNDDIATLAAQFDIRTRRVESISREDDALLLATLQGLDGDQPGGSIYSRQSAAAAYGTSGLGQALTAAEQGDVPRFVTALQGLTGLNGFFH